MGGNMGHETQTEMKATNTSIAELDSIHICIKNNQIELLGLNVLAHAITNQPIHLVVNTDDENDTSIAADAKLGGLLSLFII